MSFRHCEEGGDWRGNLISRGEPRMKQWQAGTSATHGCARS